MQARQPPRSRASNGHRRLPVDMTVDELGRFIARFYCPNETRRLLEMPGLRLDGGKWLTYLGGVDIC